MFFRSKKTADKAPSTDRSNSGSKGGVPEGAIASGSAGTTRGAVGTPAARGAKGTGARVALAAKPAERARAVVRPMRRGSDYDPALGMLAFLLMKSEAFRHLTLPDLAWFAVPALRARQVLIAVMRGEDHRRRQARPQGAVLWALVSPEVDRRLSSQPDRPIRLTPQEWRSGDIPWIVATIGDAKLIDGMLRKLATGPLKGRRLKMCRRGADGRAKVVVIDPPPPSAGR